MDTVENFGSFFKFLSGLGPAGLAVLVLACSLFIYLVTRGKIRFERELKAERLEREKDASNFQVRLNERDEAVKYWREQCEKSLATADRLTSITETLTQQLPNRRK